MIILVDNELKGARLDVVVAKNMPSLSRAYIQKLCDDGSITVNAAQQKAGYKLKQGDTIQVAAIDVNEVPQINIPILYEDEDCVVMNKPAGVLTHSPGNFSREASVASFLRDKVAQLEGDRAGIVHRLDRATSGVIIGAKNPKAMSFLQKQFASRKVKKIYTAVVEGHPTNQEAIINMPIARNPKAPATFRVGSRGKQAVTHYKVLLQSDQFSLVELTPQTGRTHQLRVHLAHIGHSIVGDPLYGSGTFGDRLFLHAKSLEITLPGGKRMTFAVDVPAEFMQKVNERG